MSAIVDSRVIGLSERALHRATGAALMAGNEVLLLRDGPEVFASWLRDIASAQRFILFENYIINHDECGARLIEALCERARAGVSVKLLYDWVGCLGTSRRLWRRLRDAGAEVRAFNVPSLMDPVRAFRRDHRKALCIDGLIGHVGGLCVGDAWGGSVERGIPPWRDTAVRVAGPAAALVCVAFNETWSLCGPPLRDAEQREAEGVAVAGGDMAARVISGLPGRSRTYRTLHLLISSATRRLWITDAYFLTPPTLYEALIAAARDGVDVRVLVPGRSDLPWVSFFSRAGFVGLLAAGVRIYEWEGPMLHAKTAVIDSYYSRVGSSNLNLASLLANWELDVLVEDSAFAGHMESMFRADLARSSELVLRPRRTRFRGRIQRAEPAPEAAAPDAVVTAEPVPMPPPPGAAARSRARRSRTALSAPGGRAGAAVARASAAVLGVALRRQFEQSAWVVSALTALLLLGVGALGLWRPAGLGMVLAVLLLWLGVGSLRHALSQWLGRDVLPKQEGGRRGRWRRRSLVPRGSSSRSLPPAPPPAS